jgi:ATP-dependent protease HslVU (ClpYQ) peptidase subunit
MTCIVGLCAEGKVYIGGDSAAVSDSQHEICVRSDKKVFRVGEFIFGCGGSFRMMNILQFFFNPGEHPEHADPYSYMCIDVSNHLRKIFFDHGWARTEAGVEKGGQFLVGYKGHLFYVGSDYQIGEFELGYYALGMGGMYALGSLYSTSDLVISVSPIERVLSALEAAEEFSPAVKRPFYIINSDDKKSRMIGL